VGPADSEDVASQASGYHDSASAVPLKAGGLVVRRHRDCRDCCPLTVTSRLGPDGPTRTTPTEPRSLSLSLATG
jgi:hypothetical protein